jgi:hypothetical protein
MRHFHQASPATQLMLVSDIAEPDRHTVATRRGRRRRLAIRARVLRVATAAAAYARS